VKKDKKCVICDKEQPEHTICDAILCHSIYVCEQCYNFRELYTEEMKLNTEKYWKEQEKILREWRNAVKS
jgi:hypothetical protein